MDREKQRMAEAAILYYEKKCTQQEIADQLGLSRQTVSKLLNDALAESIVEIRVHDPARECRGAEEALCERYGLKEAVVCSVSSKRESVRRLMTVRAAAEYLAPRMREGGKKIAVSWGHTVEALIGEMPLLQTADNVVFPLFGATDHEMPCFSSNELAREMAEKIGAAVRYAWFPYLLDRAEDAVLLKKTSYYKKMEELWGRMDLAIVGIGNRAMLDQFEKTFGCRGKSENAAGDIATHFFSSDGQLLDLYQNTLCATEKDLRAARQTVGIACGNNKTEAICGALKTGILDVLVTDEYTARQILK